VIKGVPKEKKDSLRYHSAAFDEQQRSKGFQAFEGVSASK